jgi:hypothetical protein
MSGTRFKLFSNRVRAERKARRALQAGKDFER